MKMKPSSPPMLRFHPGPDIRIRRPLAVTRNADGDTFEQRGECYLFARETPPSPPVMPVAASEDEKFLGRPAIIVITVMIGILSCAGLAILCNMRAAN